MVCVWQEQVVWLFPLTQKSLQSLAKSLHSEQSGTAVTTQEALTVLRNRQVPSYKAKAAALFSIKVSEKLI